MKVGEIYIRVEREQSYCSVSSKAHKIKKSDWKQSTSHGWREIKEREKNQGTAVELTDASRI